MEYKKKNWKSSFNTWLVSIIMVLATILMGLCFTTPKIRVHADGDITQDEIVNKYGIHFVAAKTKSRQASGIDKVLQQNGNGKEFYTYQYAYDDYSATKFYYDSTGDTISTSSDISDNALLNLNTIYSDITPNIQYDRYSGYIPYGADYFDNVKGQKEETFYDRINENDFVLLNNYYSANADNTSSGKFNVENFYLSFGSPYIDEHTTTPLNSLSVSAMLYSADGSEHDLAINTPETTVIATSGTNKKYAHYWHQYIDLKNLQAYTSSDSQNRYDVEEKQGRYEFKFTFIPYNQYLETSTEELSFTFSFYLLDADQYTVYPTLNNADILEDLQPNSVNEYFYNFTQDTPYIKYDPSKFNLSYTRANNKTSIYEEESITSQYSEVLYNINEREHMNFPMGVLTYYKNDKFLKEVYILTNHNKDKSLVEHIYLSSSTQGLLKSGVEYIDNDKKSNQTDIITRLKNKQLDFEYKITAVAIKDTTTADMVKYNVSTFKTTTYQDYPLILGEDITLSGNVITSNTIDYNVDTEIDKYTISLSNNTYSITANGATNTIATLGNAPVANGTTLANISDGVVLDKNTLEVKDSNTSLTHELTKYKFSVENLNNVTTYKLIKTYLDGTSNEKTTEIILNSSELGENRINDPINSYITIIYQVTDNDGVYEINPESIEFKILNQFPMSSLNTDITGKLIQYIIDIDESVCPIDLDYSYEFELDKLGIYNFNYSYVCPVGNSYLINSISATQTNSSHSSNLTTPIDFTAELSKNQPTNPTSSTTTEENLYFVASGFLGETEANAITLNGNKYTYVKDIQSGTEGIIIGADASTIYQLNTTYAVSVFGSNASDLFNVTFKVDRISGRNRLRVMYEIGTVKRTITTTTTTTTLKDKDNYRNYITTIEKNEYTLHSNTTQVTADKTAWQDFYNVIRSINAYTDKTCVKISTSTEETLQGVDRLHIFGSITYFNREDISTDSGDAELKQIDNRLDVNFKSDVTSLFVKNNGGLSAISGIIDYDMFKGKIASLLTQDNIIVTDVAPIHWENFSTLLYNNKKSQSYIYRYTDYRFDTHSGKIIYDVNSAQVSTYHKDIYCQFDGLYEIVVLYTYENLPDNAKNNLTYFQVFTFIIDNSSPELILETKNADSDTYSPLGLNTYTNKSVRLSWEVADYFKNNVYVNVNKRDYGQNNGNTYSSESNQSKIISMDNTIVNTIYTLGMYRRNNKNYYYLSINNNGTNKINGDYIVTLHYNTAGKSSFTEQFIIDQNEITGLQIQPVMRNNNGTYSIDNTLTSFANNQIINTDFTFRFNAKSSGAKIYAYYDRIELSANSVSNLINTSDNKFGITTDFEINADKIATGTQYSYNYDKDSFVPTNNLLTSSNSSIFLFRLYDEAGNECRYVVFYDKTQPNFITEPNPDKNSQIVNDTTRLVWGDYKAIKVTGSIPDISLDQDVTNTSVETDTGLALMLRYMNSAQNSTTFNKLKVEKIGNDYYILVPITNVTIEDNVYLTKVPNTNLSNEYYFFPSTPVQNNKVVLPVKSGQSIEKVTYWVKNSSSTNNSRYWTITYYADPTLTEEQIQENSSTLATKTIYAISREGEFTYSIQDGLTNTSSGIIWMNTDQTETYAVGLFDYSDNVNNAIVLPTDGVNGATYSASKLFISSKISSSIPAYTLTGMHFAYDTKLYTDYHISSIELVTDNLAQTLKITMTQNGQINNPATKDIEIPIKDKTGQQYPTYSYPYSLDGRPVISGTDGKPTDIYNEGFVTNANSSRKYSLALNTTTDTNKQKIVTEEGLYIFTREYTENLSAEQLANDTMIRYYIYYVDRSGIIDISPSTGVSSNLHQIGKDINFTLGSNYSGETLKKTVISPETIQNNQISLSNSTSNSNYLSSNLFTTNKIQVQFNMTYDKHAFMEFVSQYKSAYETAINKTGASNSANLIELVNSRIFDTNIAERYKLELTLSIGGSNTAGTTIINEKTGYYSASAAQKYLNSDVMNNNKRNNYFKFSYDIGTNYYIVNINDNAGYRKMSADGKKIEDANYLANNLNITFDINHNAPEGEFYGKYYGRHNYDNNATIPSKESIPTTSDGEYALLSKYLQEGQLEPLSNREQSNTKTADGNYVKLYATNNETLVFTFTETQDEYQAQIDPYNLQIYKGSISPSNLILNRVGSKFVDCSVSSDRQAKAWIENIINDTKYYGIIIFDNNLDEILDEEEKKTTDYSQFRLLDANQNPDRETYYIKLYYVGTKDNYKDINDNSFFSTTYEIGVDRIKPTYNLTKLMSLDKYVYNTIDTTVTKDNFEAVFESYKSAYNFHQSEEDKKQDFYRSILENYFFAIDYRENTSFNFESISTLDNNQGIYIRKVDKNNYKFSITPDDYKAYYNATYLSGHPQFTPSNAIVMNADNIDMEITANNALISNKYYNIRFTLDNDNNDNSLSANYLKTIGVLEEDTYYEIIEEDSTGNFRVYAIYVPHLSTNKVIYNYQKNSSIDSLVQVPIIYGNTPTTNSNGMNLQFTNISIKDNYLRANLEIITRSIHHNIDVIFDPNNLVVTVTNRTTRTVLWTYEVVGKDKNGYTNSDAFITAINYTLEYYNRLINDTSHAYYSQYGYNVNIDIVDRIGIASDNTNALSNYQIIYTVAGSTLFPVFVDNYNNFTMKLSGQKGSTHLTKLTVWKFNKSWTQINVDNSATPKIFNLSIEDLKQPIDYLFTRGVYKFVFTDNFGRENIFFHEYGISTSQTGGSLHFTGNTSTQSDGYTYSAEQIQYSFDSSVYNVYIKYIGKKLIPNDTTNEYEQIDDARNEIIYNSSSKRYQDNAYLLANYGISATTSGNITTITFSHGISNEETSSIETILSKYHIKTILASNSENYSWGDEVNNSQIFVYDKKIALYRAIQDVAVRNLSGNTLNSSSHLNLTEDFELVTRWPENTPNSDKLDFNSRIILTRVYNDNGTIKTTSSKITSGQIISQPGDYTAYVINDLGMTSKTISFTRGQGEISMYAVYAVDKNNTERKLTPSSMVVTQTGTNKVLFTYFITNDYFSYKDALDSTPIRLGDQFNPGNIGEYITDDLTKLNNVVINTNASKYLDVRVNSNLNIETSIFSISVDNNNNISITYQIYSTIKNSSVEEGQEEFYTYRYVQIVFIDSSQTTFATTRVYENNNADINLGINHIITSTAKSLNIIFDFGNAETSTFSPIGDTMFVDRYYNGVLVETTVLNMNTQESIPNYRLLDFSSVGLHEFVIRDLAGRIHQFNGNNKLSIYLINQVLFTVNNETPINNQIFNGEVHIGITYELSNEKSTMPLYNKRSIEMTVYKNGQQISVNNDYTFSQPGYYSVEIELETTLIGSNNTRVRSSYCFVIVDQDIANRSFSISKSSGFIIEKIIKTVRSSTSYSEDLTQTYATQLENSVTPNIGLNGNWFIGNTDTKIHSSLGTPYVGDNGNWWIGPRDQETSDTKIKKEDTPLVWLSHKDHGNSVWDITLKKYDQSSNSYKFFTFNIWINDETPTLLSNIPVGTNTKETISVSYNPGLIYSQIGKGYITLDDQRIIDINESSQSAINSITINQKGEHWIKIYSEDGKLVGSYKFTKSEPLNKMTKTFLIILGIAAVAAVVTFMLLRRKGRYR